jgi:hypothetical protein
MIVDTASEQIVDPLRSDADYAVMHEPHSPDWIKSIVENTLTHHDVRCTSEVPASHQTNTALYLTLTDIDDELACLL